MKRVTVADAPAVLNINDKAFWAIGWNDCAEAAEAAVKQARIDALEEAKSLVNGYVIHLGDADRLSCAIESLKGKP